MVHRNAGILFAFLPLMLLTGCGGGSKSAGSNRKLSRDRVIATSRVMRVSFAMTGLGRRISLTSSRAVSKRVSLFAAALRHSRDVQSGKDDDTGLYYTLTVAEDGSGHQDLFLDAARAQPAGSFSWPVPQWKDGQPNTYPAILHVTFSVTAGEFAGTQGTMDITLNDATGTKGLIHLLLKDSHKDYCDGNFQYDADSFSANQTVTLPDNTTYQEQDVMPPDGLMQCLFIFPDGARETVQMNSEGIAIQFYTDSSGNMEATGSLQDDGMDNIQFDDGSSEFVDVDTEDTFDDSESDNSDDSDRKVRRVQHNTRRR